MALRWTGAVGVACGLVFCGPALANLDDLTQGNPAFDDLERAAARANQATYDALLPLCGRGVSPGCTVAQATVFENTRELVQTANELLSSGPTEFSLGLDEEGLADALRWTAVEEVTGQKSITTEFTNGQLANLNNRITALRFGASGFSIAGISGMADPENQEGSLGTAGSAETLSRWGGFANITYGYGDQNPTTFADAFDYENTEGTIGVDYRLTDRSVLGVVLGYSDGEIDFDSSKSIVDGGIKTKGWSLAAFGMYSWDQLYISGSISYQGVKFDVDRFIKYPSFNPDVESVNTRTASSTDSDAFTLNANAGYVIRFGRGNSKRYVLEPYVRAEYITIDIDGYQEKSNDPQGEKYFTLDVDKTNYKSMKLFAGARASAAISTSYGVLFPYVRAEWISQLEDDITETNSQYAGIGVESADLQFVLESDKVDQSYGSATVGIQTIVRGGRQKELGGPIRDRLSLFLEYREIFGLTNVSNSVFTGGFRYLF